MAEVGRNEAGLNEAGLNEAGLNEAGLKRLNPDSIGKPVGAYSHGVLATTPGDWLHISGQVGLLPTGGRQECHPCDAGNRTSTP